MVSRSACLESEYQLKYMVVLNAYLTRAAPTVPCILPKQTIALYISANTAKGQYRSGLVPN